MFKRIWSVLIMAAMLLGAAPFCAADEAWTVTDLQCNAMVEPMTVDRQNPTLSWRMEDSRRGAKQAAFRVIVNAENKQVWDSGWVENDSPRVDYAGEDLKSTTVYSWTVTVRNQAGEERSASSTFETAFMNSAAEFTAEMISAIPSSDPDEPEEPEEPEEEGYVLECTVNFEAGSVGIIFGATENQRDIFTVQVSSSSSATPNVIVPMRINLDGSPKIIRPWGTGGINYTTIDPAGIVPGQDYRVRMEVRGTTCTVFIDGNTVGSFTSDDLRNGGIGLRHSKLDPGKVWLDDFELTDLKNNVLFAADFSVVNPFPDGSGTIENGRLAIAETADFEKMDTVENLNVIIKNAYDVEATLNFEGGSAGIIFSAKENKRDLFTVQISSSASTTPNAIVPMRINLDGSPMITRPWGTAGINYTTVDPAGIVPGQDYRVRIAVRGTTCFVYIDGNLVGSFANTGLRFECIGLRHSKLDPGKVYIDDFKLTNGDGEILFANDFSMLNPFPAVSGNAEEGRLAIAASADFEAVDNVDHLNAVIGNAYDVEATLNFEGGSAGLVFSAKENRRDLFTVQISSSASTTPNAIVPMRINLDGSPMITRPWGTGGINYTTVDPAGIVPGQDYRVRIAVRGTTCFVYINENLVGSFSNVGLRFECIGIRHSKLDPGKVWMDDLKLTGGDGETLLSLDFSAVNPFPVGALDNGRLVIEAEADFETADTVETLSASFDNSYNLECTVNFEGGSVGIVFGATENKRDFFTIQISSSASVTPNAIVAMRTNLDGSPKLTRPWGTAGVDYAAFDPAGFVPGQDYRVRIEVRGNVCTVKINGTVIGSFGDNSLRSGGIGFRHSNLDPGVVYFDDFVLTDVENNVLFSADFTEGNPFPAGLAENGRLWLDPNSDFEAMDTVENLNNALDNYQMYDLEYTINLQGGAAGFIFGGLDSSDYFFIQINTTASITPSWVRVTQIWTDDEGKQHLRQPFTVDYTNFVPEGIVKNKDYRIRLEVRGHTGIMYVDGTRVGAFSSDYLRFGALGFRHMRSSDDCSFYDDVLLTDGKGTTLFSADFTESNPFRAGLLRENRLWVDGNFGNIVVLDTVETLNSNTSGDGNYDMEYDLRMDGGAASLIFSAIDTDNFFTIQVSSNEASGTSSPNVVKVQRFYRTDKDHVDRLLEVDVSRYLPNGVVNGETYHVRLEVRGTTGILYFDSFQLGMFSSSELTYGGLGFRHMQSDDAVAYYGDFTITHMDGHELFSTNFSEFNPFGIGIVKDGWLLVDGSLGNITYMDTMENLLSMGEEEDDSENLFTIETDFKVVAGAGGITFGGTDARNLLLWQINLTALSTHERVALQAYSVTNDNYRLMAAVDCTSAIPWETRNDWHHIKIEVNENHRIYTYLDGKRVYVATSDMAEPTQVGFRHCKTPEETAYYDNYSVTVRGETKIQADFEGVEDPFSTGRTVLCEKDGNAQNHALYLSRNYLHMRLIDQEGAPMFRKTFTLQNKQIASARLYATALGVYEAYINGQRVGNEQLAPGWTQYYQNIAYQVYDVTDLLQTGKNAIGAVVGDGWYAGHVGEYNTNYQHYGVEVGFKGQLRVVYTDGTVQTLGTDKTWKFSKDSPYLVADNYEGETYDATREQPGWNTVSFDDKGWKKASPSIGNVTTKLNLESVKYEAQNFPGIHVYDTVSAKSVRKIDDDTYIFDMGQEFAGVVTLRANGVAGQTVRLRYAEMLYNEHDGDLEGTLYTRNLRSVFATDYYTFKEDGLIEYTPTFTYHGFRYVEVKGLNYRPSVGDLTGVVWSSLTGRSSSLETSEPLLDRIYENAFWSTLANFMSTTTDCPQRDERLGFNGDAQSYLGTAILNSNVLAFMEHYLEMKRSVQGENGGGSNIAPELGEGGSTGGNAGFMDSVVTEPWYLYENYGDLNVLAENYEAMAKWTQHQIDKAGYDKTGNLIVESNTINDHLNYFEYTNAAVFATLYLGYDLMIMHKTAGLLGKLDDEIRYINLFTELSNQFREKLMNEDGRILSDTQTAYALALYFGVIRDENLKQKAAARLAQKITDKGYHITTGFMGILAVLPILSEYGYSDIAYKVLLQTEYPSWGFMINEYDATTTWERWDSMIPGAGMSQMVRLVDETSGDGQMNSYCHMPLGIVCEWMIEYMAGIKADIDDPGYHHIIMKPQMTSIKSVNASYESVYGKISSAWQLTGDQYTWTVTIPANTTATVYLPGPGTVDDPACVTDKGGNVLEIGSGTYTFTGTTEINEGISALSEEAAETDLAAYQMEFGNTKVLADVLAAIEEYLAGGNYTAKQTAALRNRLSEAKAAMTTVGDGDVSLKDYKKNPNADRYEITTVSEWVYFEQLVNDGVTFEGKTVALTRDLDFSGVTLHGVGAFVPDHSKAFKGTLEGNGHILKNVQVFNLDTGVGVFNNTFGAVIKDFGVTGTVTGNNVVGGIVGYADGGTVISGCWNEARVMGINGEDGTGGIAGNLRQSGTIIRCYNAGTVTSNNNVAGICAYAQDEENAGYITDCFNYGKICAFDTGAGGAGKTYSIVRFANLNTRLDTVTNCWYLESAAGSQAAYPGTYAADEDAFADGTVADALDMHQGVRYPKLRPDPLAGDVNRDDRVDMMDALWLLRYLSGISDTLPDMTAADLSGDGGVGLDDLTLLLRKLSEN